MMADLSKLRPALRAASPAAAAVGSTDGALDGRARAAAPPVLRGPAGSHDRRARARRSERRSGARALRDDATLSFERPLRIMTASLRRYAKLAGCGSDR